MARESKFCIWSPVPQRFCKHFTIVTTVFLVQNLESLPGQSCQFYHCYHSFTSPKFRKSSRSKLSIFTASILPVFYHWHKVHRIFLPMNYHYFTSQNKLHKITSILPKALVKLLNGRTGKILVKT